VAAMDAWARGGRPDETMRLMREMERRGLQVGPRHHVEGCC
jgi:pentatricopeptide repeat protein